MNGAMRPVSPTLIVLAISSALLCGCDRRQGVKAPETQMAEHAVIVHFEYGQQDLAPLHALEGDLIKAIEAADAGELDGSDVATDGSEGSLYMYGPDAARLFEAVRPVLESATCIRQAVATLRYGPPEDGVRERRVKIGR
ncbi:MAG: hypothetical protein DCC65_14625 [Planctomycetota bacterium]|nr:MAG: hypothetical protein DCC65_14625 [Planctomycetota bacterium]